MNYRIVVVCLKFVCRTVAPYLYSIIAGLTYYAHSFTRDLRTPFGRKYLYPDTSMIRIIALQVLY